MGHRPLKHVDRLVAKQFFSFCLVFSNLPPDAWVQLLGASVKEGFHVFSLCNHKCGVSPLGLDNSKAFGNGNDNAVAGRFSATTG